MLSEVKKVLEEHGLAESPGAIRLALALIESSGQKMVPERTKDLGKLAKMIVASMPEQLVKIEVTVEGFDALHKLEQATGLAFHETNVVGVAEVMRKDVDELVKGLSGKVLGLIVDGVSR